ncbi:MAG: hypothetical protein ABF272_01195, partial [Flavobacteriales bacterium]
KRKLAELEFEMKKLKSHNAANVLDFETKIKEMELKYTTQIDSAKLKAEAELDKVIVSNRGKAFFDAEKSANKLSQEIEKTDEQPRTGQAQPRIEPSEQG